MSPDPNTTTAELVETWLPRKVDLADFQSQSPRLRLTLSGPDGGDWELWADGEAANAARLVVQKIMRGQGRPQDPDIWVRIPTKDFRILFFPDADLPMLATHELLALWQPRSEDAEAFVALDGRLRIEILGRRHRTFSCDLAFGPSGIRAGQPRTQVIVDGAAYQGLLSGILNPVQALLSGHLRVEGDRSLALRAVVLGAARMKLR